MAVAKNSSKRASVSIDATHGDKFKVGKPKKVTFGSVTVLAAPISQDELDRNLAVGQNGLSKAMARLSRPGFFLRMSKDIAYYRADPNDPKVIIRELNGEVIRGRLVDGEFEAL